VDDVNPYKVPYSPRFSPPSKNNLNPPCHRSNDRSVSKLITSPGPRGTHHTHHRPPMSAIQEHLTSFLAFPSGLLGSMPVTQFATSKPAEAHLSRGSCLPATPPRPRSAAPNEPVPQLQAPTSPLRRASAPSALCRIPWLSSSSSSERERESSSSSSSKRVSWADEYYAPAHPKPRTQAQRLADREHPLSVRLQGFAAAERTALAHADRARKATALNTLHADSHHEPRAFLF
jgi:hypothetical protein